MRSSAAILVSSVALSFLPAASSSHVDLEPEPPCHCLTQAEATLLTSRFGAVFNKSDSDIGDYRQTAEAIISENYYAVSDSILILQNQTLDDRHVNVGKQTFIEDIEENGSFGIENTNSTLSLVADCTKVLWYFQARGYGPEQNLHGVELARYRVKGFYLIFVDVEKMMIDHVYTEFNSVALGLDVQVIEFFANVSMAGS